MIKLIALDLDGTLMSADHLTVSEENRKALKLAHEMGAKIAIATGRTLAIIGDVCDQVPEVDYIICSNGAVVVDRKTKKPIFKNCMSWDKCAPLLNYLDKQPAFVEVYIDGKDYVQENKAHYFESDVLPKEFTDSLLDKMEITQELIPAVMGKEIEKVSVYINDKNKYKEVYAELESDKTLCVASALRNSIEFTNADANKGTAMAGMCDYLGITAEECMAFGDAGNDREMLKFAHFSYAMENGTDECKSAAHFETASNVDNGVALAIYKHFA